MKHIMALVVLISLVSLAAAGEADWRTFTSPEGGFTVLMPGIPSFAATTDHTVVGAVIENLYSLKTPAATFSAEYSDLPGVATFFDSNDSIYEDAKKGLLKDAGGRLISYRGIEQAGIKGKELEWEIPSTGRHPLRRERSRFLLKDERLYVLNIAILGRKVDESLFSRYLDSFKILNAAGVK